MDRVLIFRVCDTTQRNYYWDKTHRTEVSEALAAGAACSVFNLPKGTLIDSWYEGTTLVEIRSVWDGSGRPPRTDYTIREETPNAGGGGQTPCGLQIDGVQVVQTGATATLTIFTSGYSGAIEYSLNQFVDVQDSNVFTSLTPGNYVAYARAKN